MKIIDKEKAGIIYSIGKDDVSLHATVGKNHKSPLICRQAHNSLAETVKNINYLNRAVRCEHTLLFAGNLPVFAMGTTKLHNRCDPPLLNLGQLSLSVEWQGKQYPFAQADTIKAEHIANGTKWHITFDALPKLALFLYASLMGDHGIVATLSAKGADLYEGIMLHGVIGDFKIASRNFLANWFNELSETMPPDIKKITEERTCSVYEAACGKYDYFERSAFSLSSKSPVISEIKEHTIVFQTTLGKGNFFAYSAIHSNFDKVLDMELLCKDIEAVEKAQIEAENRLKALLDNARVQTPSQILNAGLHHAVLNHDYTHMDVAWLEGCHWWNCYWTNNYQISAAISLGQYERAKKALLFFGTLPEGYSITSASGNLIEKHHKKDGSLAWGYDGIPYYLYQLWQYTQHTGDFSVAEEVAEHIHKNCLELMEACDPDSDGLYSWHSACNSFMYQTDHFAVPGAGASPSLMLAGGFERFSQLLHKINQKELAAFYRAQAKKTYKALKKVVWEEQEGYFLTTVDLQGTRCRSHYYTDLVFPALYTGLEDKYKILPLLHLKDSLTFRSQLTDGLLMRVGEQKPDLFGNNNVMPVQMAEAARAFSKMGDGETGFELMEACALANSIFTESPGSSPERLNDYGKGETNYMFGNPAASVVYSAIDGLFGIRCTDWGKTLTFSPALPKSFGSWSLDLSYVQIRFSKETDGDVYRVILPEKSKIKKCALLLPVASASGAKLFIDGQEADFTVLPSLRGQFIKAEVKASKQIEIKLQEKPSKQSMPKPIHATVGQKTSIKLKEQEKLLSKLKKIDTTGVFYALIHNQKDNVYYPQPIIVKPKPMLTGACVAFRTGRPVLQLQGTAYGKKQIDLIIKVAGHAYCLEGIMPDKEGEFTAEAVLKAPLISLPVYGVDYQIFAGKQTIGQGSLDASAKEQTKYPTVNLDIKPYLNADFMAGFNCWRGHGKYLVKFGQKGNTVNLPDISYTVVPAAENPDSVKLCLLEYGRSNVNKGVIERGSFSTAQPAGFPDAGNAQPAAVCMNSVSIQVGIKVGAVSLLYLAEVEIRLTYERLGKIVLNYADGSAREIPLVSGTNMGSIFSNYANDTVHVPLYNEAYVNDSANHYAIGCDSSKVLESVDVILEKEDVQLAIAGMNLYIEK